MNDPALLFIIGCCELGVRIAAAIMGHGSWRLAFLGTPTSRRLEWDSLLQCSYDWWGLVNWPQRHRFGSTNPTSKRHPPFSQEQSHPPHDNHHHYHQAAGGQTGTRSRHFIETCSDWPWQRQEQKLALFWNTLHSSCLGLVATGREGLATTSTDKEPYDNDCHSTTTTCAHGNQLSASTVLLPAAPK